MNLMDVIFMGVVAITLIGGILAVSLRNVFYNALSLILCLFGVACLFIYLNSEFLAIMEVIIYIGAISIAIIFAIMLSQPALLQHEKREPKKIFKAFLASALLLIGLVKIIRHTAWPISSVEGDYGVRAIGKTLLTTQVLGFEAVSLVLLVAIIGALVISSKETR